jgi:DNA-binding transcriptional regulator LsrR (DeoR family)
VRVQFEYLPGGGGIAHPWATTARNIGTDELRLLAKIARMYHERGVRQPQIAADLHISQSRVSRLLKLAADLGIVRTTVTLPSGVYTDLEEELEGRYGLADSVIVDADGASGDVLPALGAAAATYLTETLTGGDIVWISSWSSTLLATVEAMRPRPSPVVSVVTQLSAASVIHKSRSVPPGCSTGSQRSPETARYSYHPCTADSADAPSPLGPMWRREQAATT